MTDQRHRRDDARVAADDERTGRARWEATQESLREKLDEPLATATRITRQTMAWFPVRVWRWFLHRNGFLLAAGVSYQALFALSAAIYVVFASVGLWLGGSSETVDGLVDLINGYIPGLISANGLISRDEVQQIASTTSGVLGITGAVALVTAAWTAIGWVTFSRRAVRDIFGLKPDLRNYFMLKARDLLAAIVFGVALIVGGVLSFVGTWALSLLVSLVGWDLSSVIANSGVRIGSVAVSFALNAAVLGALFRFLTSTSLRWRRIWPGALVGGAGLTVLQVGAGLLLVYTPSNPLLATFAIFIGLLLWFRLVGVVMLVAASWIAVAAQDDNTPILPASVAERLVQEHEALLFAARVRVRTAQHEAGGAPWYRRWAARRRVAWAQAELAQVEGSTPPPVRRSALRK